MNNAFIIAVFIFLLTYVVIVSERVHRTIISLLGACLMIIFGIVHQERAIEGVDFNTLGLLIGMMVIVTIARGSGIFQFIALWTSRVAKGKPIPIFILLGLLTAIFSAFLDNVTTVLLMVPVAFVIANNLKVDPKPILIATILLSNIGGAATLIGDPPNILIGSAAGIPFNDFLTNLGPLVLVLIPITTVILVAIYRKKLVATKKTQALIMQFKPIEAITNWPLLWKSLAVLAIVLAGFFTHTITHLEGATIALTGAALLLLLTVDEPDAPLREVEWTTIFFFIGLFILVTGLEEVGAIRMLAEKMLELTGGDPTITTLTVLWASAVFSAIVDNIPFVATMIPLIKDIGALSNIPIEPLWWALAIGADIGGNATIIGASANVVVSGMANQEGHKIGFVEYLKIAVPLTAIALVISTGYVWLRYLA